MVVLRTVLERFEELEMVIFWHHCEHSLEPLFWGMSAHISFALGHTWSSDMREPMAFSIIDVGFEREKLFESSLFLSQSYFFLLQKAVHATSSTLTSMVFFEPCTFILWKKQLVSWNKRKESSFISAWEWGNYWNLISGWTILLCLLFLQLVINCMGINKKCNYWCCVTVLPRSMGSASPLRYIVY